MAITARKAREIRTGFARADSIVSSAQNASGKEIVFDAIYKHRVFMKTPLTLFAFQTRLREWQYRENLGKSVVPIYITRYHPFAQFTVFPAQPAFSAKPAWLVAERKKQLVPLSHMHWLR